MPFVYTNLNIPRLADAALESYVKTLAPLNVFSTVYSPAASGMARGNQVLVPLVGTLVGTTFGGSYAISTGSKSVITVTINRHKVVHIGQRDIDALDNSEANLDSLGYQAGAALAQTIVEDVLTTVCSAKFAQVATADLGTLGVAGLRAAKLALDKANAPTGNRFALIDAVGMDALLAVTNFVQAHMFADNTVLREGRVMRALGFDFYQLNSSFVSAYSVTAFLGHASAMAVAMRYMEPQNPESYQVARSFTDPKSGATFGLRDMYDPLTGQRYIALEANYGYAAGITNGGRTIQHDD